MDEWKNSQTGFFPGKEYPFQQLSVAEISFLPLSKER